jgi:hypothetical protein
VKFCRNFCKGWGDECGLLETGPLPPPFGGCEGKDLQNLIGDGLSDYVNGEVGVPGPSVVIEIACCLLKALHGTGTYKDWRGPQQQQEPGFQCETAAQQRCGLDAMAKEQKETI